MTQGAYETLARWLYWLLIAFAYMGVRWALVRAGCLEGIAVALAFVLMLAIVNAGTWANDRLERMDRP